MEISDLLNQEIQKTESEGIDVTTETGITIDEKKGTSHKENILTTKIGNGKKQIISVYGQHGNEYSSIIAFATSPRIIKKYFTQEHGEDFFNEITYTGLLLNLKGIQHAKREHHTIISDDYELAESDLNRQWKQKDPRQESKGKKKYDIYGGEAHYFKTNTPIYSAPLPVLIAKEIIKEKTQGENSLIIDHHADGMIWNETPYLMLENKKNPESRRIAEEAIQIIEASNTINFKTNIKTNIRNMIDRRRIKITPNNINIYGADRETAIYSDKEYLIVDPEKHDTLSEYADSQGIPAIMYEDPSQHLFLNRKKTMEGAKRHASIDIAAIHLLTGRTKEGNPLKNLKQYIEKIK